ncbi:response regulator [Bacillus sp. E214]|uniref:response regulator transcription factor n=1 Tax=Bacillus sp. E214 TaxID=2587156 RepID=UPI0011E0070F|nr:response regulator [Bacillus sp. E214]
MTFKMLIVDDEPIISRGLRLTIPWETIDVEVVDTAHDGEDAIEKVIQYGDIDIVITDIRMPKMDGLQLARFLYANYPQIRTIILSGFEEFEYAQQAIKLGVDNYFLKPVDINELVENVKEITNEMKQKRQQKKELDKIGLRNAILQQVTNLQRSSPVKSDDYNGFRIYPFISMHQNYKRKITSLSEGEYEEFLRGWEKSIERKLQEYGLTSYSFFTEKNILVTCVHSDDGRKMTSDIRQSLIRNDGLNLQFVWSDEWIPVEELMVVLTELLNKGRYLAFTECTSIIVSDQLRRDTLQSYPTKLEEQLIEAIIQKKDLDLHTFTNELFGYFTIHEFFLDEAVQVCREMLNKILDHYKSLSGKNVRKWDLYYSESINVHEYNSFELLRELFYLDLSSIRKYQSELKNFDKQDLLINHAKEYIHEYYRTNIRVHEVAEVLNITPNYFSSLFKQKTSVNFNEYVNQLRVDEAKILLAETPFKVNEISEQVGFHEYKYFVGVFKKLTGMTATDYRKFRNLQDRKTGERS